MRLTLTSDAVARLGEATRTLLSPLAAPDVDAWRRDAMGAVCGVVGAETGTFTLPGRPCVVQVYALDDGVSQVANRYLEDVCSEQGPAPDPVLDAWYRVTTARGVEVWDMHVADHLLGGRGLAWDNEFCHEVLRPHGLDDTHALFVPSAPGCSMLAVHNLHRPAAPGEHLALLHLLFPAFKAGLDALARFDAQRTALDVLAEPLAVFDLAGREVHRNPALAALLAVDPGADRVCAEMGALAAGLRALGTGRPGDAAGAPVERAVATPSAAYRLRGALLGAGLFGADGAVMVSVQREGAPPLPSAEVLRERHGLTRREAEVALLLAEGLSNAALAERLFISPHTARHHTERVLDKLGLTSRKALALHLLQPG
ncbi:response regulator transcription factor [Rubrivirga sp. IMCC45206]|uniref:helix-turn-helix transcriptional regulator n=1 Tax=Rubrivirga sp. IMCC45206 TaxID=3391614 RepID=UPI0039902993